MKTAILLATLLIILEASSQTQTVVRTDAGKVSGSSLQGIRIFKGIPFASPPTGELRWKPPMPAKTWKGVRKCVEFGPSPMQAKPAPFGPWTGPYLISPSPIGEDCLYLNVWTPANKAGEKLPVLVWIYGGGFSSGGSSCRIYDGKAMASKGIVVVSFNYRVGLFGFFAHPELSKESTHQASGNYGLLDQIAALQWVSRNIRSFGGDPTNVTIAGQSAGSMSVNALVASPLAKGLFKRAIAQSGANFTRTNPSLAEAEQEGLKIADGAALDLLRRLPAEAIMDKASGMRGPVIDGYVLPEHIADIFRTGKANKVDLLTGWNIDEGLMFGPPKTAGEFRKDLTDLFGSDSTEALGHYMASTDGEALLSQLELSRDRVFAMHNYIWAKSESERGNRVYLYRFGRKVPAEGELARFGAFHTGEVPYVFDNLEYGGRPYSSEDSGLANLMSSFWVNFIKTGNPNAQGLPDWPLFGSEGRSMYFDLKSTDLPTPEKAQLELLHRKTVRN